MRGQLPTKLSELPLGRLHGHRGTLARENKEDLGATSLGDPAKVIVLRESIFTLYDHDDKKDILRDMKADHIDILGQLEDERGLVGWNEVESNITGLRPKDGQLETWDDFNELVKQLQDGFTIAQLARYTVEFGRSREPDNSSWCGVSDVGRGKVLTSTPWMPGISQIEDHFDRSPLRGYSLESHTSKQRVVLKIMRECWDVSLPELIDGIGQFELGIREEDMDALLGMSSIHAVEMDTNAHVANPYALGSIHETYLILENEKLEAFRSRNVLRVTTSHAKMDMVIQAVQQTLETIRIEKFDLGALAPSQLFIDTKPTRIRNWAKTHFDAAALEVLSQLTKTSITKPSKSQVCSFCPFYRES